MKSRPAIWHVCFLPIHSLTDDHAGRQCPDRRNGSGAAGRSDAHPGFPRWEEAHLALLHEGCSDSPGAVPVIACHGEIGVGYDAD
jgi:hypothetical protein